ncbi:MAG: helix-turn-helix domain-containing protein [Acidimicrobiales bacterium]|nr:helix-turn-helix domain-containing protein [Acidimicrobiales bacterium]
MSKRDYKQFCPAARALNLIGERWTLLIVRDLLIGPRRYSEIKRGMPGMASNLLAVRLAEMSDVGLLERRTVEPDGRAAHDVYALTDRGRELEAILVELARFGFPFLDVPTDDEPLLAERVPLGLRALMFDQELPDGALTMRFDLDEGHYLVAVAAAGERGARLSAGERVTISSVGDGQPEADATISGSLGALLWVRQGMMTFAEIETQGLLTIEGAPDTVTAVRCLYRLDPSSR